jgi:hypothetical protein
MCRGDVGDARPPYPARSRLDRAASLRPELVPITDLGRSTAEEATITLNEGCQSARLIYGNGESRLLASSRVGDMCIGPVVSTRVALHI